LTPVQAQAAAAESAGIHRTTVYHWFRTVPEFEAVGQAKAEFLFAPRDEIDPISSVARAGLRSLIEDKDTPHAVKLKAILATLQRPQFPAQGWTLTDSNTSPQVAQAALKLAFMQTPRSAQQDASGNDSEDEDR